MTTAPLQAPFPYFGGKRKAAETVWPAFGRVDNYVEPFAGSAAMLLAAPEGKRVLGGRRPCVARRFDLRNAFRGMRPAARSFFNSSLVRFGEILAKFGYREFFPVLVGKRLSGPCCPHLRLGFFRVRSAYTSGRDFFPSLIRMLPSNQRSANFLSSFLRYNSPSQRLARSSHGFFGAFFSPEGVCNFFDVLRCEFSAFFRGGHFFSRCCTKNQPGYTLSAIGQVHQIKPFATVKGDPLFFSKSPILGANFYNIHARCQSPGGKLIDPIRLVCFFVFCPLNVLRKSALRIEAPANVANVITDWVREGVNEPSFFCFVHSCILQHIAVYFINRLGWHIRTWTAGGGYARTGEAIANRQSETIWCSPHCVPERGVVQDLFAA